MKTSKILKLTAFMLMAIFTLSCNNGKQESIVNLEEILPGGANNELTFGNPDLKVVLVPKGKGNTEVFFEDKVLRIDGVEEMERRVRIAKYVVQYMENPNKAEEDKLKREAYKKLPPKEKLADLLVRIRKNHPDFEYKWVGLGEGNVKVEYGDNTLLITGVKEGTGLEEFAHAITNLQKEIDAMNREEGGIEE